MNTRWRIIWGCAALVYFTAATLSHDPVSDLYTGLVYRFGRRTMEAASTYAFAGLAAAAGPAVLLRAVKLRTFDARTAVLWGLGVLLVIASDRLLISTNVERIHYPQYAVLAMLLMPALGDGIFVLLVCLFCGALDELVQYAANPGYTQYLDFNDMILNLTGAFWGLAIWRTATGRGKPRGGKSMRRHAWGLVLISALPIAWLRLSGRIASTAAEATLDSVFVRLGGKTVFIMSLVEQEAFWNATASGRVYHVLTPLEGLAVIAILTAAMSFAWFKPG